MFIIATIILTVSSVIYAYFKIRYRDWEKKGVPFIQPTFPYGNFENFFKITKGNGVFFKEIYDEFKSRRVAHGGIYVLSSSVYVPVDRRIIRRILSADFEYFSDKDFYINEKDQPISAHLFSIGGEKWKGLRQKLTPTFTSGKMKMMLDTLIQCRIPLLEHLSTCALNRTPVNIKEVGGMFTTDVIGSVAFGIDCDSFKNPNSDFRRYGKAVFKATPWIIIKGVFSFTFPKLSQKLGVVMFERDVEHFFNEIIAKTIAYREENGVRRNDMMDLMVNLMKTGSSDGKETREENRITLNELMAQAFVFFIAGYETSSSTVTFCMFELAQHQDVQDKVRREIRNVLGKHDGKITYEALGELVYMKQVIDEALRKYPPLSTLDRKCVRDYKIPGTDVTIDAGTSVTISTLGLHMDPDLFPDPEKFDPDRFSKENVAKIEPFTYLPFGEGPRMCIGLRFGLMQTKIALLSLLQNHKYTLNERTKPVMEYNLNFILHPKGDILLDITEVD